MVMIMMIRASLCIFRKEDKHRTLLPPQLGNELGAKVKMGTEGGDGCIFADSCRALKSQFQGEEPSMACTTAVRIRKLIVLLDYSAQSSTF